MLRGERVRPGDVDVEVATADGAGAARTLGLPAPSPHDGRGGWSLRTGGEVNGVRVDLSAGLVITGPGGTLHAGDAPVDRVPGTGGRDAIPLVPMGEALARAIVTGSGTRRVAALAALPDEPVARADAIAYAESRAAAARAAR